MEIEKPITKKQFLLIKYTLLKQYLLEQPGLAAGTGGIELVWNI
jgi:hypothetical protein